MTAEDWFLFHIGAWAGGAVTYAVMKQLADEREK